MSRQIKCRPTFTNDQVRLTVRALHLQILELSKDQATNLMEIIATIKLKEYMETFIVTETPDNSEAALLAKYLGENAPALEQLKVSKVTTQSATLTPLSDEERYNLIGKKPSTERTPEETRFYLDYGMKQMLAMSKQNTISDSQL